MHKHPDKTKILFVTESDQLDELNVHGRWPLSSQPCVFTQLWNMPKTAEYYKLDLNLKSSFNGTLINNVMKIVGFSISFLKYHN